MKIDPVESHQDSFELPLIITREFVIFPHTIVPFVSDSPVTSDIINHAMENDRLVFFAYPNEKKTTDEDSAYLRVGTVVKIIQVFRLKDNLVRMIGESLYRAEIISTKTSADDLGHACIHPLIEISISDEKVKLLMQSIKSTFSTYSTLLKHVPKELRKKVQDTEQANKLVDIILSHLPLQRQLKLDLLQNSKTLERLQQLLVLLNTEIEMIKLQGELQDRVKTRLEKIQKEYFLHEQIRQIHKELGREVDEADEADELLDKIKSLNPPEEIIKKATKEANRLRKLQTMAPESGVIRTYLEWLSDIPWDTATDDNFNIVRAKQILDEDHYNMVKPKERILDYLAVRSIQHKIKGPILCLVGPPGTGKTSLGRSVARTMGRKFLRISLGGIRDEAEIRGHRKTYVGALPGKIIQSMKKGGTKNPVFVLDEIDKMSSDFRGDPSSAMLEVLDPEQNSSFADHYLEVPYDLSQVLFIATANSLHTVPSPLRDRMEIIEVPGYSDIEKYHIASKFLIPKQLEENGLDKASIRFRKDAIMCLIHEYTMESGVRQLERTVAKVIRKVARIYVSDPNTQKDLTSFSKVITAKQLLNLIGKPIYANDPIHTQPTIGLAHGLAWTEMGGRMLSVEAVLFPGTGKLILTGNLGEVMKESARISLSYIYAHTEDLSIDPDIIKNHDIHIHVPQGAIPKDGPSAGLTLTITLFSALTGIPIPADVSMTGEMTLTGKILAIGGVKEKVLASYRNGIKRILLPIKNENDAAEDIPRSVHEDITISYVSHIQDALYLLFPERCTPTSYIASTDQ